MHHKAKRRDLFTYKRVTVPVMKRTHFCHNAPDKSLLATLQKPFFLLCCDVKGYGRKKNRIFCYATAEHQLWWLRGGISKVQSRVALSEWLKNWIAVWDCCDDVWLSCFHAEIFNGAGFFCNVWMIERTTVLAVITKCSGTWERVKRENSHT